MSFELAIIIIMKQSITQAILVLICTLSIASSGKECPPRSIKTVGFAPQKIKGDYKTIYCTGEFLCSDVRCLGASVWNRHSRKSEFNYIIPAVNTSTGKAFETRGILKFTGPGRYSLCSLNGKQCDKVFALDMKSTYLIEFACLTDPNGEIQEVSWISARDNHRLSHSDITHIKKSLRKSGLDLKNYKVVDNKHCRNLK